METNTFGAHQVRLDRFGFGDLTLEINAAAAQLAQHSAGERCCVAGGVGPLGITADEAQTRGNQSRGGFREQITELLEGGANLIFFETFLDYEELDLALRSGRQVEFLHSEVPSTVVPEEVRTRMADTEARTVSHEDEIGREISRAALE